MKPSCLKHSLIPGTSHLFSDYLYHFDRISRFYAGDAFSPETYAIAAQQIQYPLERRARLVEVLTRQNPGNASLTALAKPETVAVVTGQQVGLFSGPAYTIYKALTAVRLARRLTEQGISAVPVFWLATEDHDLEEVDHVWTFGPDSDPQKLVANCEPTQGPAGSAVLTDVPIEELAHSLAHLPYGQEVVDRVAKAYCPGATLGAAFRQLLSALFEGLGILFLDPLDPDIRNTAAPFLAEAAHAAPHLVELLRGRDAELLAAGYHSQVHVEKDTSPFFLLDQGRRVSLKLRDGRFVSRNGAYSAGDLQARAADISPNALLRPVMQDYLLPTVAYVGGPAEVAYMAQAQVIYRELLGRMPVIMPRNGFTLLNSRATKLLDRYGLQVQDLLDHRDRVQSRIAERLVPTEIDKSFKAVRETIAGRLVELRSELSRLDPTLVAAAHKSEAKMLYQLDKLAGKGARAAMQRTDHATGDANFLINMVYPHGHLQERFYTILPFIARHGFDLISHLAAEAQLDCPDHMIRTV
jgi:bacillithiol biosynthesis cysteine-adding enzyme BshC